MQISNLNSKKVGTFGNIPAKVLKYSSNVCNAVLRDTSNFDMEFRNTRKTKFSTKFKTW